MRRPSPLPYGVLLLLSACGFGTAAIVGASGGGTGSNGQSVASALLVPRSAKSPATILFTLTDQERDAADVAIAFRTDPSESFRPIRLAPGSAPLTRVPSRSTPYGVLWDFAADLGGEGYRDGIEIRLTVARGISPPILTGVAQGNDPPSVVALVPAPAGAAEYGGNTDVVLTVADTAADAVDVKVEYNDDPAGGFPESAWRLARPAATPAAEPTPEFAVAGVAAAAGGVAVTFRWDTLADLDGFDDQVRIRCTAVDAFAAGPATVSAVFRVDNNAPPQAILESDSFALGAKDRGNIPVPFRLVDAESDPLDVLVQWRADGQEWPPLPATAAELRALLHDPLRAAERRQLQIAVEAPSAFGGRVGALLGLTPEQIRLPELAGSAAGLLAYGLGGRTLEILRPAGTPVPVAWPALTVDGPVDALVHGSGTVALVLDVAAASWRLREIDLATGAARPFAAGPGAPRALARDPANRTVFVGTDTDIVRIDRLSGAVLGSVAHGLLDGPRGLAGHGTEVALATGDDALVRCDFASGSVRTLTAGLAEPWGIAAANGAGSVLYVAERALDRVSRIDLLRGVRTQVPAAVAPADVATLGAVALPSPRALALDGGARLLVMTEFGAQASLRALELNSPIDRDGAPDGRADPFVRSVGEALGDVRAGVATGPDRLLLVSLPAIDAIALAGGVSRRATIDPDVPYDPRAQIVTLRGVETPIAPGAEWRIRARIDGKSSPEGARGLFVWDTADVPDPDGVQVRIVPLDADLGFSSSSSQPKPFRPTFDASAETDTPGRRVAIGDLDGDGDLDLASVVPDADQVSVTLQTSAGAFTTIATSTACDIPEAIAIGDLDADGVPELAVASNDGVCVFRQTAPGRFAIGPTFATDGLARFVDVVDLDGDGGADLVAANTFADSLALLRQTGPLQFAAPELLPTGSQPQCFAVGDYDGDGDRDVVTADAGSSSLSLYLQDAAGAFGLAARLPTGSAPAFVAGGDLDGDGDLDIAAANTGGSTLLTFLQTAPGQFTAGAELPTGDAPDAIVIGDFDGDGDNDIGTADVFDNSISLLYQTAPGQFTAAARLGDVNLPRGLAAGDLNGDGAPDLVASNYGVTTFSVFTQPSPRAFSDTTTLASGDTPASGQVGDLDGDGDLDLIWSNSAENSFRIARQSSPGRFLAPEVHVVGTTPRALTVGDLDGDGDLDVVVANAGAATLSLLLQAAPGVFAPARDLPAPTNPAAVVVGDLDGDGDLDIVTRSESQPEVGVHYQVAPGEFVLATSLDPGTPIQSFVSPQSVLIADMDHDGLADVVTTDYDYDRLGLIRQTAPGAFAPPVAIPVGARPAAVVAADVDGDGELELACVNRASDTLTIVDATVPGRFAVAATLPVGAAPGALAAGDLDGDGRVDFATADRVGGTLTFVFQTARGVFLPGIAVESGMLPVSVAIGDLDGDGDADAVAANFNNASLTLFRGGR